MYRNTIVPQASPAMPQRLPAPSHRHGAPSGPWPFVDIDDEVDPLRIEDPNSHIPHSASACEHRQTPQQEICWCKYPQSLYPNWTTRQQKKSRILKVIEKDLGECNIYYLDVMKDGTFLNAGTREVNEKTQDTHWGAIQRGRPSGVRVRVLFVENLSGPVLQMLGTRYNIEPFFFSSSIGRIPSRFQSNIVADGSDHITVCLTYVRTMRNSTTALPSPVSSSESLTQSAPDLMIDTQAPLSLRSSSLILASDQLALHMVRSRTSNTIISLHGGSEHRGTTAEALHQRVQFTGRSVYWSNIFKETTDPTFVFLSFFWYAMYAWDEALEHLYKHICALEAHVMYTTNIAGTQELHLIRAHLLHYESLLIEFRKTVSFVLDTPHPAASHMNGDAASSEHMDRIRKRECGNILLEIERLEKNRSMQDHRLKNVMDLGFSTVNIEDSRQMRHLTEAAVRDSAAMKQISYLTMVFLPSSFVAAIFGMNIPALTDEGAGSLRAVIGLSIGLTAITVWVVVAYQIRMKDPSDPGGPHDSDLDYPIDYPGGTATKGGAMRHLGVWDRLWWPVVLISNMLERRRSRKKREKERRLR